MTKDSAFIGSIPAMYEEWLVPILFRPFADDLIGRVRALAPRRILELAAGTGVVSHGLAVALPNATIVATDLNAAMLDVARERGSAPNLTFSQADAQALPFADDGFDMVVAQFGAMFFPDKVGAYREMHRVLTPGGMLLFNVWDGLEGNSGAKAVYDALRDTLPEPKPGFLARTPYGYHDGALIRAELEAAGFTDIAIARATATSPAGSAETLARGLCLGSPVAGELSLHSPDAQNRALAAAISAAEREEGKASLVMTAWVISARA